MNVPIMVATHLAMQNASRIGGGGGGRRQQDDEKVDIYVAFFVACAIGLCALVLGTIIYYTCIAEPAKPTPIEHVTAVVSKVTYSRSGKHNDRMTVTVADGRQFWYSYRRSSGKPKLDVDKTYNLEVCGGYLRDWKEHIPPAKE